MDKKILVFNNKTGIAEKMAPLLAGEGMEMSVASDVEQLRNALDRERFHLMLVDVELNDKGWDKGIELIAGLRKRSSIPLIVISDQCAETAPTIMSPRNAIFWSCLPGSNPRCGGTPSWSACAPAPTVFTGWTAL